jgi:fumarylacetoacetase
MNLNETHDPNRRSFLGSANESGCDFPIQNLPLCIFHRATEPPRGGIVIGDQVLDLAAALAAGLFAGQAEEAARAASGPALNPLMALGNRHASALRARVAELLGASSANEARIQRALVPIAAARFEVPARVGTFTDFLCSIDHTRRMSRTGELPPAFRHLPIAYHSRASTVTNGQKFTVQTSNSRT